MRKINLNNFQVATSLTARDINRRIILNVIRTGQPVSRADVARLTGLQRSTVSLIVDQLIDEGWVAEGELGRLPRGRRPTYLYMNAERGGIIGVDVRASHTTIAYADLNGKFRDQETFPTDSDPDVFRDELIGRIKGLMKRHPSTRFEGIGLSLPGTINKFTQQLMRAANLGWQDVDFKTPLEKATRLPVEVQNAANACALAENYFGGSQGVDNLIAVTVAEGIGTGIVCNGQKVRGASGMAGEFGHISLDPAGPKCGCGNRGCWEALASNSAALRRYNEYAASGNGSGRLNGKKLTFAALVELAGGGDAIAQKALEETAYELGRGLAFLVTGLEPNRIIIVGEITRLWSHLEPVVHRALKECGICSGETEIVPVDDALQPRLRGTVALVLEKHFGAPVVA